MSQCESTVAIPEFFAMPRESSRSCFEPVMLRAMAAASDSLTPGASQPHSSHMLLQLTYNQQSAAFGPRQGGAPVIGEVLMMAIHSSMALRSAMQHRQSGLAAGKQYICCGVCTSATMYLVHHRTIGVAITADHLRSTGQACHCLCTAVESAN